MKTRWISASILFSILISPTLSGCDPIQSLVSGVNPGVLQDESGQMQITLPDGWEKDERFNDNAVIQASNVDEDLYVIVLADDPETLSQYSLDDNSYNYRYLLVSSLQDHEEPSQTEMDSIAGKDAVQYEIQGQIEGAEVTYLHTTVATDNSYYQVVAWTNTDQYETHKSELQKIVESFREN